MDIGKTNVTPKSIALADGTITKIPFTTERNDKSLLFSEKWKSLTIKLEENELVYCYESRWGRQHDKTVRQPL